MANYEELLKQIKEIEKEVKDKVTLAQKLFKTSSRNMENGDLKNWTKDINALRNSLQETDNALTRLQESVEGFNIRNYVESGEFHKQLISNCESLSVDVKGDFPNYEMFPFRVRMDVENLDMFLDRKKIQCMRPLAFVQTVKASRDKMLKAPFEPSSFVSELATAYDLALLKQNQGKVISSSSSDIYLKSLYNFLTPMRRFRKDYDQQSFAFDLARLYSSEVDSTDDGRKFQFGPSRNIGKCVRILDKDGVEQYLATIRFYKTTIADEAEI